MVNLETMLTIAERLRWAREASGLSARALSALAGASPALVGMLEREHVTDPRTDTMRGIAGVLGVSMGWLLAGEGEPPTEEQIRAAVERARAARTPSEPPAGVAA